MLAWASLLACGDGGPSGLSPALTELPPAKSELTSLQGRWEAVTLAEGSAVRCEGETAFVELRGDGEGGWELLAQLGPDLAILPVLGVERSEGGLSLQLAAVVPGEPDQALQITWLEPGRLATFQPLLGDRPFVAPSQAATVPVSPCPVPAPPTGEGGTP